ncbi:hypothetical protein RBB50_012151 [Rhinocladiella similis]
MSAVKAEDLGLVLLWHLPKTPSAYLRNDFWVSAICKSLGNVIPKSHSTTMGKGIPAHLMLRYLRASPTVPPIPEDLMIIRQLKGVVWSFVEGIDLMKDPLLWWDIYPALHEGHITTRILRTERGAKVHPEGQLISGRLGTWLVNEGQGWFFFAGEEESIAFDANDAMKDLGLFGFQGPMSWMIEKSLQALRRRQQMERLTLGTNLGY